MNVVDWVLFVIAAIGIAALVYVMADSEDCELD